MPYQNPKETDSEICTVIKIIARLHMTVITPSQITCDRILGAAYSRGLL